MSGPCCRRCDLLCWPARLDPDRVGSGKGVSVDEFALSESESLLTVEVYLRLSGSSDERLDSILLLVTLLSARPYDQGQKSS